MIGEFKYRSGDLNEVCFLYSLKKYIILHLYLII